MYKLVNVYMIVKDEEDEIGKIMKEVVDVINCELRINEGFDGLYEVLDFDEVDIIKKGDVVDEMYVIDGMRGRGGRG